MDIALSTEQARILGVLLEKEVTTPDYYPMTLNALVNACNQKSCREPVTAYDEGTVSFHLDLLREENRLASLVSGADSRVPKFRQRLTEQYHFTPAERALLTELLLRGPQTAGELKNRAERMHPFASTDEVAAALKELETRPDGAWIVLLPRQPGRKEARYMHLLCGPVAVEESGGVSLDPVAAPVSPVDRIAALEAETARLREELEAIRQEMAGLKNQLGA